MINQQLLDFIKQQLSKGLTKEVVSKQLLDNGWSEQDVEEGFKEIMPIFTIPNSSSTPTPPLDNINLSSSPIQTTSASSQQIHPSTMQPTKSKTKFFSWKGRIGRSRYLITSIILGVVFFIANAIIAIFAFPLVITFMALFGGMAFLAIPLFYLFLSIIDSLIISFVVVKRFHDINKDGWYFFGLMVPFFNFYLLLSLFLECGMNGPNKYGDDPLPPEANHDGFLARLGRSVAFKLIVTLLLSALVILGLVISVLNRQETNQERINQTINQVMKNSLTPSSTSTISPPSTTSTTPPSNQSGKIVNTTTTSNPISGWQSKEVYNASNPSVCYTIKYPSELVPKNLLAPGVVWFQDPSDPKHKPNVVSDGLSIDVHPNTTIDADSSVNGFLYNYFSKKLNDGITTSKFTTDSGLAAEEFLMANGSWYIYVAMPGVGNTTILFLNPATWNNDTYNANTAKEMAKTITPSCGQ